MPGSSSFGTLPSARKMQRTETPDAFAFVSPSSPTSSHGPRAQARRRGLDGLVDRGHVNRLGLTAGQRVGVERLLLGVEDSHHLGRDVVQRNWTSRASFL
jgi:hypothetical protein